MHNQHHLMGVVRSLPCFTYNHSQQQCHGVLKDPGPSASLQQGEKINYWWFQKQDYCLLLFFNVLSTKKLIPHHKCTVLYH